MGRKSRVKNRGRSAGEEWVGRVGGRIGEDQRGKSGWEE